MKNCLHNIKLSIPGRFRLRLFCALFPALTVMLSSCRELYFPEVESMEDIIIVSGLITDQTGMSSIKLSYNAANDEILQPLSNAMVYVTDDEGNIFPFRDNISWNQGQYFPDPSFAGEPGRTYTLHIETEEDVYQSSPQVMVHPARLDSVYPRRTVRDYLYRDFSGSYRRLRDQGIEVYADAGAIDSGILRFRAETTLLLLYNFTHMRLPDVDVYYRWKKIRLTDAPEININRYDDGYEKVRNHLLCFLPSNKVYYQLDREEYIHQKIVIIRYFTLNQDSYRFHFEANKQVNSENKLFDPAVSQLPTNMRCVSDPDKPVIGLFDVSSTSSGSYMLVDRTYEGLFNFIRVADMENVPNSGSMLNEKPYFWQD